MKRIYAILFALLFGLLPAPSTFAQSTTPDYTLEVLVQTTPTAIPHLSGRRGVELQNLGPNSIYCSLASSTKAVVDKAREIPTKGDWAINVPAGVTIWCVAKTAAQATGAATIVTQAK